jgi:hypothetical protein
MTSLPSDTSRAMHYRDRPRASARALAALASGPRRVRRRPRSVDERALIRRMALLAVAQREAEGRLVRVGHRHYIMRTRPELEQSDANSSAPTVYSPQFTHHEEGSDG